MVSDILLAWSVNEVKKCIHISLDALKENLTLSIVWKMHLVHMNLQRLFFNTRKRMRKEGIKRQDFGCCPGHDKFPNYTYNTRASKKAKRRTDQLANMRARRWAKRELLIELELLIND